MGNPEIRNGSWSLKKAIRDAEMGSPGILSDVFVGAHSVRTIFY